MLLNLLLAISIGIEGGYHIPAVGFNNINTGTSFSLFAIRKVSFVDLTVGAQTTFYTGDNQSYHLNTFGLRVGIQKSNWPISPVFAIGGDYISRDLNQHNEAGVAVAYSIGVLMNFRVNQVLIYPKVYYDGLTDMKVHAGFIGLRLGIGYEI
jgi:hypothetical protein